jgi:hypothetical protein
MSDLTTTKPVVEIIGEDGNAFAILAKCKTALKRAGRAGEWETFYENATLGDYNHLLAVVDDWFEVQ